MASSILSIAPDERYGASPPDGEVTSAPVLLQNWQVIKRFKWVAIGIIGMATMLGIVVTMLMTPQYTAKARVEISREQKNFTNVRGVDQIDARQDLEFYQTQYSLLESRSLAERVVRELRLANRDEFFTNQGVDPADISGSSEGTAGRASAARAREKVAVDLLLEHVEISPIQRSSLVDVGYSSGSPALSAEIANSWVRQFIQASIDRRYDSTADARSFLEQRLAELRTRVEDSERAAVAYAERNNIVSVDRPPTSSGGGSRTLSAASLEALNDELVKATAARMEAESRVRARGAAEEGLSNPAINGLRQRRAELSAQKAQLLTTFEPTYPVLQALQHEIDELSAQIVNEEIRVRNVRANNYREALTQENSLRGEVVQLKAQVAEQQRDSIQYNIFQREADTNRQLYDALLQRYKEIGVAGVDASNIAIVDSAQIPDEPSSPNLLLNLVLALAGGAVLAGIAVFILDQVDEGLRDPNRVYEALGIPLLGSVPKVEREPIESIADPKSELFEAYLTIRSALALSSDHGFPRSLMLTSSRSGEGKSTSALALATVLARTSNSAILIDADMRSPSVHELVGLENSAGLSNLLAGEDDWRTAVRPTKFTNLSVLTAGPQPPNAAELLSSGRAQRLIAEIGTAYNFIVIDAPPMLGLADAPLLSQNVEGAIFVVEADGVSVRGVRAAIQRLKASKASVLGVIMTKLQIQHASYSYGYSYGHKYGAEADA